MKRAVILFCIAIAIISCKKESEPNSAQAGITGKWLSTFASDNVMLTSTKQLLTEINYKDGQAATVSFDGKSTAVSFDPVSGMTFTNPYTLTTANDTTYMNASLFGRQHANYKVVLTNANTLVLSGIIAVNVGYTYIDGTDYNVYYYRTEIFSRQ